MQGHDEPVPEYPFPHPLLLFSAEYSHLTTPLVFVSIFLYVLSTALLVLVDVTLPMYWQYVLSQISYSDGLIGL